MLWLDCERFQNEEAEEHMTEALLRDRKSKTDDMIATVLFFCPYSFWFSIYSLWKIQQLEF